MDAVLDSLLDKFIQTVNVFQVDRNGKGDDRQLAFEFFFNLLDRTDFTPEFAGVFFLSVAVTEGCFTVEGKSEVVESAFDQGADFLFVQRHAAGVEDGFFFLNLIQEVDRVRRFQGFPFTHKDYGRCGFDPRREVIKLFGLQVEVIVKQLCAVGESCRTHGASDPAGV